MNEITLHLICNCVCQRAAEAKMAEMDRTNSDEKDQLAQEIDVLRKKLALGGGAVTPSSSELIF